MQLLSATLHDRRRSVGIGFMLCMLRFFRWLFSNDAPKAGDKQP